MTISMEKELRLGLMEVAIKAFIHKVRKMDKGNILGKMVVILSAHGKTIRLMGMVFMFGVMEGSTKEIG